MLYGRAEFESFEIERKQLTNVDVAKAVVNVAGLGEGSVFVTTRETDQGKIREFLMVIREEKLIDISPEMYLIGSNPDVEITPIGKNRFWVGFNSRYDHELVGIIHDDVNRIIQG